MIVVIRRLGAVLIDCIIRGARVADGRLGLLALSSTMPSSESRSGAISVTIIACHKIKSLFVLSVYTKYYNQGDT